MPIIGSIGSASARISANVPARDPHFNQVAVLINGENSTNTIVADASTNNFTMVPATTTVHASNFSPFNTSWSNQFDGSTGYLNYAFSPALSTATTPFTIECWICPTSFNCVAIASSAYGGSNNIPFVLGLGAGITNAGAGGNIPWFGYYTGSSWIGINSSITLSLNNWYHIAGSFNGSVASIFVNGILSGSITTPWLGVPASTAGFYVGRRWDTSAPAYFPGYISNFRFNIGVALYTANFTPPTAPLISLGGSTILLTCQSPRFVDNSSYNMATPITGTVAVSGFSPFPETDTATGSMYFNGSNDYVSNSSTSLTQLVNIQNNDMTFEGWIYISTLQQASLWGADNGGGTQPKLMAWMDSSGHLKFDQVNSTMGYEYTTTTSLIAGQWYHLAFVRAFSTSYIFVNGQSVPYSTTLIGTPIPQVVVTGITYPFVIGGALEALGYFSGYISNFRFTQAAVYTSNFTIPSTPYTVLSAPIKTQLLTLQYRQDHRNQGLFDNSTNKFQLSKLGQATQSSFSPYSQTGWSTYFNGGSSNDRLTFPSSTAFDLSAATTTAFTIEFWMFPQTFPSVSNICRPLLFGVNGTTNSFTFQLLYNGQIVVGVPYTGTTSVVSATGAFSINTWTHIAFTYNAGFGTLYVNGVNIASQAITPPTSGAQVFNLGYDTAGTVNYQFQGFISNVRVVKLIVYTGNFNVPSAPLAAVPGTVFLTCQSPQFIDNSSNNFSVTLTGSPRVLALSPFYSSTNYNISTNAGSIYLDGSSSGYTLPATSQFYFSTNNFTIEFWMYPTSNALAYELFDLWVTSSPYTVGQFQLQYNTNQTFAFYYATGTATYGTIGSTATVPLYAWTHVALARVGNTVTMYFNGSSVASGTVSQALGTTIAGSIGRQTVSTSNYFPGYISNLRVVNGNAIYTGNFTPPKRAYGAAVNNLINFSEQFNTGSWTIGSGTLTTNAILAPDGVTYASLFQEDSSVNQHLLYYALGTVAQGATYTLSGYFKAYGNNPRQLSLTYHGGAYPVFDLVAGTVVTNANFSGTSTITAVPGQPGWYRCSVTSTTFATTGNFYLLPWNGTNNYQGNGIGGFYVWGLQLEYGSTMNAYTSTPANIAYPPSLLLLGSGSSISDQSAKHGIVTYGNAAVNASTVKYGSGAISISTSADMVALPYSQTQDLLGDFTIELWFYANNITQGGMLLNHGGGLNIAWASYEIWLNSAGNGTVGFAASSANTQYDIGGESTTGQIGTYAANTWYHVAVTRQGNVYRGFLNGVQGYTQTLALTPYIPTNRGLNIGASFQTVWGVTANVYSNISGYIDDVRITNGYARYTANFTPPTQLPTK